MTLTVSGSSARCKHGLRSSLHQCQRHHLCASMQGPVRTVRRKGANPSLLGAATCCGSRQGRGGLPRRRPANPIRLVPVSSSSPPPDVSPPLPLSAPPISHTSRSLCPFPWIFRRIIGGGSFARGILSHGRVGWLPAPRRANSADPPPTPIGDARACLDLGRRSCRPMSFWALHYTG